MSNFKLQSLANAFPRWTKANQDSSSLTQRFLEPFAECFDAFQIDLIRFQSQFDLLKLYIGVGELYSIDLDTNDHITYSTSNSRIRTYNYPSLVEGDHATLGTLTLTRVDNYDDFLLSLPFRINVEMLKGYSTLVVWDSTNATSLYDMAIPERLYITVDNSTIYKRTATSGLYSGAHLIKLKGIDENDNAIEENVDILDDGVYFTRNIFKSLTDTPQIDGFDGNVVIGYKTSSVPYNLDIYRTGYSDQNSGPLKFFFTNYYDSGLTHESNSLTYYINIVKYGEEYRTGSGLDLENQDILGLVHLLDADENTFEIVDCCFSFEDARIYSIDTNGFLHIHESELLAFSSPNLDTTAIPSPIELHPVNRYARYLAEEIMFTYHARMTEPIKQVIIKRVSPTGIVRYLQSDKTWGASSHTFTGALLQVRPENSWNDLTFTNEFDEYGQWDFYITTVLESGSYTTHTGVMVANLVASKSFDTELADLAGIFSGKDGKIIIYDEDTFYEINQHFDIYLADPEKQQLFFREEYRGIEVTY